jgi:hypothetical protein
MSMQWRRQSRSCNGFVQATDPFVTNMNPKKITNQLRMLLGRWLAGCFLQFVSSGNPYTGSLSDCSVRMWSVETGQELKKFLGHRLCRQLLLHALVVPSLPQGLFSGQTR